MGDLAVSKSYTLKGLQPQPAIFKLSQLSTTSSATISPSGSTYEIYPTQSVVKAIPPGVLSSHELPHHTTLLIASDQSFKETFLHNHMQGNMHALEWQKYKVKKALLKKVEKEKQQTTKPNVIRLEKKIIKYTKEDAIKKNFKKMYGTDWWAYYDDSKNMPWLKHQAEIEAEDEEEEEDEDDEGHESEGAEDIESLKKSESTVDVDKTPKPQGDLIEHGLPKVNGKWGSSGAVCK
jgi:hypothetical protein